MKTTSYYGLGISVLFVLLGYYLYFEKSQEPSAIRILMKPVGLITMLFFGTLIVVRLVLKFRKTGN